MAENGPLSPPAALLGGPFGPIFRLKNALLCPLNFGFSECMITRVGRQRVVAAAAAAGLVVVDGGGYVHYYVNYRRNMTTPAKRVHIEIPDGRKWPPEPPRRMATTYSLEFTPGNN